MRASVTGIGGLVALVALGAVYVGGKLIVNGVTQQNDTVFYTRLNVESDTNGSVSDGEGSVSTSHDRQVFGRYCDGRPGAWSYNWDFGPNFFNMSTQARHGMLQEDLNTPIIQRSVGFEWLGIGVKRNIISTERAPAGTACPALAPALGGGAAK